MSKSNMSPWLETFLWLPTALGVSVPYTEGFTLSAQDTVRTAHQTITLLSLPLCRESLGLLCPLARQQGDTGWMGT